MKKVHIFLFITAVSLVSLHSCNEYRSFNSVTKVSQLSGNPFYYNLSKGIIKHIGSFLIQEGLKGNVGKVNLLTIVNSIATTAEHVTKLRDMLGVAYHIPAAKLNGFSSTGTVKDCFICSEERY